MGGLIVLCKHCNQPEYWEEMRWLDGKCSCRKCYKADYETSHNEVYKWDDLNGPRPTMSEYLDQEDREDK